MEYDNCLNQFKMVEKYPVTYHLQDGTEVLVKQLENRVYDFHLTRLNSEKHNFAWYEDTGTIEESYETRFDKWQNEAVELFKKMLAY